jgi:hypothetical protein
MLYSVVACLICAERTHRQAAVYTDRYTGLTHAIGISDGARISISA